MTKDGSLHTLATALGRVVAEIEIIPGTQPVKPSTCARCGGAGWLVRDVPADDERFGQLLPCDCRPQQVRHDLQMAVAAAVGARTDVTLASFDGERPLAMSCRWDGQQASMVRQRHNLVAARTVVTTFLAAPQRRWMYLYGPPGSGKTHLALAIYHALAPTAQAGFLTVAGALQYIRAGVEEGTADARLRALQHLDVLVLDDAGTERPTAWGLARLYDLIESRSVHQRCTVFTANQPLPALCPSDASGDEEIAWSRIVSRIAQHLDRPLLLLASDYRYTHWDEHQ